MSSRVRDRLVLAAVVAGAFSLAGCNILGGSGGPPLAPVNLAIQAAGTSSTGSGLTASVSSSVEVTDDGGNAVGTITLTDARLSIEEIEFEHDNDTGEEREVTISGARVADLLEGTVTPALGEIRAPEGTYVDIEIDLNESDPDDDDDDDDDPDETPDPELPTGDPLIGYSIYVAGSYDPDGAGAADARDFEVKANLDAEFELAPGGASNGFVVDLGEDNSIIVSFRLADWFAGLSEELVLLASSVSGTIILDTATAASGSPERAAIDALAGAIEASAEFGEDLDGDDELDEEEDDD